MDNDSHHDTHQDSHEGGGVYRRIELITGTARRRRWSAEARARILGESFEPGANVSAIARRHGVSGGLLHPWRRQARLRAVDASATHEPPFVPVTIAEGGGQAIGAVDETASSPSPGGMIEIETAGALVRVPAGVDPRTLAVVLGALRRGS